MSSDQPSVMQPMFDRVNAETEKFGREINRHLNDLLDCALWLRERPCNTRQRMFDKKARQLVESIYYAYDDGQVHPIAHEQVKLLLAYITALDYYGNKHDNSVESLCTFYGTKLVLDAEGYVQRVPA